MKKIKFFIIILSVVIVILMIALLLFFQNNKEEEIELPNNNTIDIETNEQNNDSQAYSNISDGSRIFNVSNYINIYFDKVNLENPSYYKVDENGERIRVVTEESQKKDIYQVLSRDYVKNNNITQENVLEYVHKLNKKVIFVPMDMKMINKDEMEKYIIYGFVEDIDYNYVSDIYIIFNLDTEKNIYSIEPIMNSQIQNFEELENKKEFVEIEENNSNRFLKTDVNDQYVCTQYIDMYKRIVLASPEKSYEYLDQTYREKRFGTVDEYKKYVERNRDEIIGITLSKYLVDTEKNKYVCKDQYDNIYMFAIKEGLLNYRMQLDSYTIPDESTVQKYGSSTEEDKVALNIDKVIKMINSRDYKNLYSLLNENYRNTYFKTEEDFINYMSSIYTKHYKYNTSNITKENNTYILDINLSDITEIEDFNESFKLMMQLGDKMDFTISFSYMNIE